MSGYRKVAWSIRHKCFTFNVKSGSWQLIYSDLLATPDCHWILLNLTKQIHETVLFSSKGHVSCYSHLAGTHSLDVRARQEGKMCSCGELSYTELGWGELHCCHLLTVVGWHEMLTQDNHSVWIVGCQQIQARTPLKKNMYMSAADLLSGNLLTANTLFLQTFIQSTPVAELYFLQFQWASVISTRLWHHSHCCMSAPFSILQYGQS